MKCRVYEGICHSSCREANAMTEGTTAGDFLLLSFVAGAA